MQTLNSDPESGESNRFGGYTAAAAFLASDPDNETLIFRKFDGLGALNLLYMQSEILELEKRIQELHLTTLKSDDMGVIEAASRWETLLEQCQRNEPKARERMDLILDLRKKLKEYREAPF